MPEQRTHTGPCCRFCSLRDTSSSTGSPTSTSTISSNRTLDARGRAGLCWTIIWERGSLPKLVPIRRVEQEEAERSRRWRWKWMWRRITGQHPVQTPGARGARGALGRPRWPPGPQQARTPGPGLCFGRPGFTALGTRTARQQVGAHTEKKEKKKRERYTLH